MKKTFVNGKQYPHIRYTEDKAMIANPDESSFIHIQNQKISETIIKNAILTQSFQQANFIDNNSELFHIYNIISPKCEIFDDKYLKILKTFLKIDKTSYYKGMLAEAVVFKNINFFYKASFCNKIPHSGDISFVNNNLQVRVEVKNYAKYDETQINKFCYDLYYNSKKNNKYEIGLFVHLFDDDENFYDIEHNIVFIKGISEPLLGDVKIIQLKDLTSPFLTIPVTKLGRFDAIFKAIRPIFKRLLNDEGYKIITKCANNYKPLQEDKSTNTDPIIEDIVDIQRSFDEMQEAFNELKMQNTLLLAELAKKDRIINFLKQKINN